MARSKSPVERAHMITEGYLKAWADDRNVIEVIDKTADRGYLSSIKNATIVSSVYDPAVIDRDLEGEFAKVENAGVRALDKLRGGDLELDVRELNALIAFLDMYLHRGRYADRAGVRVPARLVRGDMSTDDAELALGDMLLLLAGTSDLVRVKDLGITEWPWHLVDQPSPLATGDGAVLLWSASNGSPVTAITFPISPTQLLVIGEGLPDEIPVNSLLAKNSKRWLVGARGTLNLAGMKSSGGSKRDAPRTLDSL